MNIEKQEIQEKKSNQWPLIQSKIRRAFFGFVTAASLATSATACDSSYEGVMSAEEHMTQMAEESMKRGGPIATQVALDKQNNTNYSGQNPGAESSGQMPAPETSSEPKYSKEYIVKTGNTLGELYQEFLAYTGLDYNLNHRGALKKDGQEVIRFQIKDFGQRSELNSVNPGDIVIFSNN
jgi:hypothetical protein